MVKFTLKGISNLTESPAYFQQVNGIYRKDGALALNKKINEKELLASSTSVANSDDDQADECFVEATIQDSVVLSQQLISITRTDGVVLQLPKPEYAETINLILTFCKG